MSQKKSILSLTEDQIEMAYKDMLKAYKIEDVVVKFKEEGKGKKYYNSLYRAFQWALVRGTFANDLKLDFSKIMREQSK